MDRSEQILEAVSKLNSKMSEMDTNITGIHTEMNTRITEVHTELHTEIKEVKSETKEMKTAINNIQMTLENVTNKNIMIIAEGHRDLSNKLNEVVKVENEKETLLIRLTILENEINRIKARLQEIA